MEQTTAKQQTQDKIRRPDFIPPEKEIAFSGIQPTGEVHIGNYLGATKNWVNILDSHFCIFCIVDYHAITVPHEPQNFGEKILEVAITNIACGLDPNKCILFVQSHVPEHTELTWIFNTVIPVSELTRMTQYKEKSKAHRENVNMGLLDYPVLQAADILLYKATVVPVGEDQIQHIELCRMIARKFNLRFGNIFPMAWPLLSKTTRIKGLDGKAKMSKSLGNHIGLLWEKEMIKEKLKTAFTDPARLRKSDPGHPEICNIFTIHTGFTSQEIVESINNDCRKAKIGCFECKSILAESIATTTAPIREKANQLRAHPDNVKDILSHGASFCKRFAGETMEEVRHAIGIR